MSTIKLGLVAVVLVAVLGGLLYKAVQAQAESEARREAERVQFEATLARSQEKLKQTAEAIQRQKASLEKSRAEIAGLERTLRRHDLAYLAKAKPCLIAKRMTAATRAAYQKIAETTGATLENLTGPAPKVCQK